MKVSCFVFLSLVIFCGITNASLRGFATKENPFPFTGSWFAEVPQIEDTLGFTAMLGESVIAAPFYTPESFATNLNTGVVSEVTPALYLTSEIEGGKKWAFYGSPKDTTLGLLDYGNNSVAEFKNPELKVLSTIFGLQALSEEKCLIYNSNELIQIATNGFEFPKWTMTRGGIERIIPVVDNAFIALLSTTETWPSTVYAPVAKFDETPKVYNLVGINPQEVLMVQGIPYVLGRNQNQNVTILARPDIDTMTSQQIELHLGGNYLSTLVDCNGLYLYNGGDLISFDNELNVLWAKSVSFSSGINIEAAGVQCVDEDRLFLGYTTGSTGTKQSHFIFMFGAKGGDVTFYNEQYDFRVQDTTVQVQATTSKIEEYTGIEFERGTMLFDTANGVTSLEFTNKGNVTLLSNDKETNVAGHA